MKIYITRGDQRAGPYSLAQINAFLNIGRLTLEDHAWYEGCLDWIKVKGVPGVRVIGANQESSSGSPYQPLHAAVSPASHNVGKAKPATVTRRAAPWVRIPCRICESGELMKNILPRFSRSLVALGWILLAISVASISAILLALIPFHPPTADAPPVTIVIGGTEQIPLDMTHLGAFLTSLRSNILANWQFLFLSSFVGLVFSFLFRTKKHVLQCNQCESVVAIE